MYPTCRTRREWQYAGSMKKRACSGVISEKRVGCWETEPKIRTEDKFECGDGIFSHESSLEDEDEETERKDDERDQ